MQQFCIEILVPSDFYPHQFVPNAPLHSVGDNLFRALCRTAVGFRFKRFGRVIYVRVEVPLPFQPLSNVAFPFFQQVWINSAFLIDRNQFFQFASGKLCTRYCHPYARSFRYLQLERNRVLCGIVVASSHPCSPAQMSLLDQEFPDAVRPALQLGRCNLASGLHF